MKISEDTVMLIDPKKYPPCLLTGYGAGRFSPKSEEKSTGKVEGYLKRDKNKHAEKQNR